MTTSLIKMNDENFNLSTFFIIFLYIFRKKIRFKYKLKEIFISVK
jgi:hypothetical protein